jgi:uracil-DNA glycosylase
MSRRGAILAEMGLAPIWRLRRQREAEERNPAPSGLAGGWVELKQAVAGCIQCGLHKTRTQTVFGVGDENADWMLIGEAPGAEEDRLGDPFVGQAGRLLDNMLAAIDLHRTRKVYIANVLKCRPPGNRNPEPGEVAQCSPHLLQQIEFVQPKLILAMGRFAAQTPASRACAARCIAMPAARSSSPTTRLISCATSPTRRRPGPTWCLRARRWLRFRSSTNTVNQGQTTFFLAGLNCVS